MIINYDSVDNIRLLEENRVMKEELENQKAENERLKRFAETYLKDNDVSNKMTYNFDVKTVSSRRRIITNDSTYGDNNFNDNDQNTTTATVNSSNSTSKTSKSRTNYSISNDKKKESYNDKNNKHNEIEYTNTKSDEQEMASIATTNSDDTTSSNDEQISVKNIHLASSLGLVTESAISIPKPWMKKSIKSNTTNSFSNTTNNNIDTNTLIKKSNVVLSSSLPFPESGDNNNTKVNEIDGPNSKYLHPLKNRLEELLRSVKAETTSFGEIRTSIKKRADRDREHRL
jgi:hypothetical protein